MPVNTCRPLTFVHRTMASKHLVLTHLPKTTMMTRISKRSWSTTVHQKKPSLQHNAHILARTDCLQKNMSSAGSGDILHMASVHHSRLHQAHLNWWYRKP